MSDDVLTAARLTVLDDFHFEGGINTPDAQLLANIRQSIRLGHPQVRPAPPQPERVCLVGGGPSLAATEATLVERYRAGDLIVTLNGAYRWCVERNILPTATLVMDARPGNARFVDPPLPRCKYLIASQCAPETWAAVAGRPSVYLWHAVAPDNPDAKPILDAYYRGQWQPTPGGTTVAMRAIPLLSMCGYLRFELFGIDSCYLDGEGHAYWQPENAGDAPRRLTLSRPGRPETARVFLCTDWHAKQLEDLLQLIRLHGHRFRLTIHGDGLLAYALHLAHDGNLDRRWLPSPPRSQQQEVAHGGRGMDGLQRSEEIHWQRDAEARHGEADLAAHERQ